MNTLTDPNYNPYLQPEQQQQQQQQSPMQGLGMAQQFMGGGTAGSATGGATTGGATAGGGAAGGSSSGSALASAGPWAALAAVIIGNEYGATKDGRRKEGGQYYKDLVGGKVLEQDFNYYADKIGGEDDKYGFGAGMKAAGNLSTFDFSNAWDDMKDDTLFKGIRKLF